MAAAIVWALVWIKVLVIRYWRPISVAFLAGFVVREVLTLLMAMLSRVPWDQL